MSIKEAATTPQSVAGDQLVRAHPDAGSSVAILQRSRRTPLGLLADVLDARGCSSHLVHEGSRGSLAHPTGVALAIVIGSEATADLGPADSLRSELEWLRQADAAGAASSVSDLGP